ncbi:MAG: bifunctional hydroxymethylpyrimidine kinase/phosphomethylpyrimidine kinase [Chloroflexi bacterium]|nr:bifunctional hydroxymethylpyrimidine kinase/phosphomethylpyrimidine kinase [Chloroflexota bacterium]MCL5076476.1 bifunctional hydroxymethylpyrimidine kinase/phosphomethylpyrimidine kinase [Chloroflexota bacterium]
MRTAMSIAGSDSGAGAGIQADLKTFAACGVYGTTVITAITAQNTMAITSVLELSPDLVAAQIEAIVGDIGADAVKTGMLGNASIIEVVAAKIEEHRLTNLVVDPVLVAKTGDQLLQEEAVATLCEQLIPLALVLTPNLSEAAVLVGRELHTRNDRRWAAKELISMGAKNVVIKGGHDPKQANDLFYNGREFREYRARRIQTQHTHGTGCVFAAAIAASLAKGAEVEQAVAIAKKFITKAIEYALPLGHGQGPVDPCYKFWPRGQRS